MATLQPNASNCLELLPYRECSSCHVPASAPSRSAQEHARAIICHKRRRQQEVMEGGAAGGALPPTFWKMKARPAFQRWWRRAAWKNTKGKRVLDDVFAVLALHGATRRGHHGHVTTCCAPLGNTSVCSGSVTSQRGQPAMTYAPNTATDAPKQPPVVSWYLQRQGLLDKTGCKVRG
jgi:hypothetical protein